MCGMAFVGMWLRARTTSAEIFVVCLGYKVIDLRLLGPRHLFHTLTCTWAMHPPLIHTHTIHTHHPHHRRR